MEFLDKITSVVPNKAQKRLAEMGFYAFVHFGLNTFTGKEWGDGTVSPKEFTLKEANTDSWCQAFKDAGMKGVILTAKHHDGFCLWDTQTTQYSIMNSPYGKDLVAELRKSCDKVGIALGIYLSPWDRNNEHYSTPLYNDIFNQQITELLTNYGDIFSIWFDGACGAHMDNKKPQCYDYDRFYSTIRRLQPTCTIANSGPDVRWVGNEEGIAREAEFNVVPRGTMNLDSIAGESQQTDKVPFVKVDVCNDDLGSRAVLMQHNDFIWYPAEVDVSIRPGWFYNKKQDGLVKYVDKLLSIYMGSVCSNAMLLLNVPPDTNGNLADADIATLKEMGSRIQSMFSKPIAIKEKTGDLLYSTDSALQNTTADRAKKELSVTLKFDMADIDKVELKEDIDFSQRIEKFTISTLINGKQKVLYNGIVVGHRKVAMFKWIKTDNLTITIKECRYEPHLKAVAVYATDYKKIKLKAYEPIIKAFRKIGTAIWIWNHNRQKAKSIAKLNAESQK